MTKEARTVRRLAAILAADVAGYTQLMSSNEVTTRRSFNSHFNELIVPSTVSHGGRIVKTMGDGFLAEFGSVVEAANCALHIQTALSERNSDLPSERRLLFRIGVSLADVIVEGDDIHGEGVNIAARLESIAEPGSVLCSAEVHSQISGKFSGRAVALGERRLKNIDRPVSIFRLLADTSSETGLQNFELLERPALDDRPSIAVLPFHNRSGLADNAYFAEGVSEEILAALSHVGWLFVIARSTSFIFTASDRDPRQIADELGVVYILDGSVKLSGQRVRISAELVDGASGRQLWSAKYDREMIDILDIQDEIAETIAGEIQPELARNEQDRARRKRSYNLRAWDLCQRASWHSWRRGHEDLREAIRLFKAARTEDTGLAHAYAGEAEALSSLFIRGFADEAENVLNIAETLSRQAVELAPRDAHAHYSLGYTLMFLRRHDEAEPELRQSIDINPNFAQACFTLGNTLATSGKAEDGIEMIKRAMRLSPRDPLLGQMMTRLAEAMLFAGRAEEALTWSRRALRQPNIQPSRWTTLLAILGTLDRQDEAPPAISALCALSPEHNCDFVQRRYPIIEPRYMQMFIAGLKRSGLS